ncbi:MAG: ADP-glyceromanno-heptose 6-epimerase [Alphaproteobacteria bacterium]|nr:ADP-glyceromanno-heptose 6-epimerase [Alphaproteobacteria bacterium]
MIVVTGGAGFIGANIVAGLCARGAAEIVVCDRLGTGTKWRNLAKHELADIIPPEALFGCLADARRRLEAVIHMGAISATTESDADRLVEDNFRLTMALWRWCADAAVPLIYASSAATYGDGSAGFDDDASLAGLARLRPQNAYGWSKHLVDRRIARLIATGAARPPQWVGLKFFNVYGPGEQHKGPMRSVVLQAFEQAVREGEVRLFRSHRPEYPDGGQRRDFIHVRDCVAAVLWLLDRPRVSGLFNLGTGTARSFAELAGAVFAALDRPPRVTFIDTPAALRAGYQYFTEARMARLRDAGFAEPTASLEDGVQDYVRRYLRTADPYP